MNETVTDQIKDLEARIEKVQRNIDDCYRNWNQLEEHGKFASADWEFSEAQRLEKVKANLQNQLEKTKWYACA
jgi:chaperonin cofactor prefoldin